MLCPRCEGSVLYHRDNHGVCLPFLCTLVVGVINACRAHIPSFGNHLFMVKRKQNEWWEGGIKNVRWHGLKTWAYFPELVPWEPVYKLRLGTDGTSKANTHVALNTVPSTSHFGWRQRAALDILGVLAMCCFWEIKCVIHPLDSVKGRMEGEVQESVQEFEKWRPPSLL